MWAFRHRLPRSGPSRNWPNQPKRRSASIPPCVPQKQFLYFRRQQHNFAGVDLSSPSRDCLLEKPNQHDESRASTNFAVNLTCVYKHVGRTKIEVDVFLPTRNENDLSAPIMLYIHGGGWVGGHRDGYSYSLVEEFISQGFVVASMDYRLLPESRFIEDQLKDICDVGRWVRNVMPKKLEDFGFNVKGDDLALRELIWIC